MRELEILMNPNKLVQHLKKPASEFTRYDIIKFIDDNNIEMLNFRYVGEDGKLKTLNFVITGKNYLESIELDNIYKESKILNIDGIFVEIGAEPSVYFAEDLNLELSKNKEIIVDKFCNTNIKGVYAAGDITDTPFRQLITACGQGAIAALSAYKYILKKKKQKLKK